MKNLHDTTTSHHIWRNKKMSERPFSFACISPEQNDKFSIFFKRCAVESCINKDLLEYITVFQIFFNCVQYVEK